MNPKLMAIADEAAQNLRALVRENESKLLEAWNACESEAQENETAPKFKLGLSITLDLDADKMETALTWGVRYKDTAECSIPDPAQTKLPLDEKPAVKAHTEVPTITVNMDKECSTCGERGACENGLCLSCSAKALRKMSRKN